MEAGIVDAPTEYLVESVPLAAGDTLAIVDPRAVLVYAAQGRVWITEEHDAEDVVVEAGGWRRLDREGTAVVEALAPSVVLLTSPHAVDYASTVRKQPRPALDTSARTRPGWRTVLRRALAAWRRPRLARLRLAVVVGAGMRLP